MSSQVNEWVRDYVDRLFRVKGYDCKGDKELMELVEEQWENWKRLMVQKGLNKDQHLAQEVAYEFSLKKLVGGAAKIFEQFAEFVVSRPNAVVKCDVSNQVGYEYEECQYCEGRGAFTVPFEHKGRISERAVACVCGNAQKYAGIQVATPAMIDIALKRTQARELHLEQWCWDRGLDMHGDLADFNAKAKIYRDSLGPIFRSARPEDLDKQEEQEQRIKIQKDNRSAQMIEAQVEALSKRSVAHKAVVQVLPIPTAVTEGSLMATYDLEGI